MNNLNKIHKELTLLIVDLGHDIKTYSAATGNIATSYYEVPLTHLVIYNNKLKEIRRLVKEIQKSSGGADL